MGTLQIDVLGASFLIKAKEDDEYLKKLLGYYKRIADEIEAGGSLKDPVQIAILSGIMLCDELYKEKSKNAKIENAITHNTADNEAERLTLEMIEKIDRVLK
jgi:cell division protein ZapA (FtsZ GTPase activity inhibitor)